MDRLLTNQIATMTELREPHKVLERANGRPVAIMKNSRCVGYLVPAEGISDEEHVPLPMDAFQEVLARTAEKARPVMDYLKDK